MQDVDITELFDIDFIGGTLLEYTARRGSPEFSRAMVEDFSHSNGSLTIRTDGKAFLMEKRSDLSVSKEPAQRGYVYYLSAPDKPHYALSKKGVRIPHDKPVSR